MSQLQEGEIDLVETPDNAELETQEQEPQDQEDEDNPSIDQQDGEGEIVEEDSEPLVTFGDENPEEQAESVPFKKMRKALRDKEKTLRDLQKQVEALQQPEPVKQLRKKPTLADHDYDESAYESDLEKYTLEKRSIESEQERAQAQRQQIETEFKDKVVSFNEGYSRLSYKDKDDALQEVLSKFDDRQQGVIVDAVDNPAMIVYALGKNPQKLEELCKIKNLVRLSSQLGKLETQMKVTNRKPSAAPDKAVKSSSGVGGTTDRAREKLVEEARRTKNRSKLLEYDRLKAKKG